MNNFSGHVSVLLQESIRGLDIQRDDVVVDATLGGAGHSEAICALHGGHITLIGLDADEAAIERARARLTNAPSATVHLVQENFRNIDTVVHSLVTQGKLPSAQIDKALFDLGLSSQEIESSGRGFSFKKDEPLLMTFSAHPTEEDLTARMIVNEWDEENIETIIKSYGEERYARRIARAIVARRARKPIETTFDLVNIILEATPSAYHRMKIHPATRTFQALRMTVNDEVRALTEGMQKAFELLRPGGRIAVISFHSIEDRIVKRFFTQLVSEGRATKITKKPITPTDEEIAVNPRARSAKLRIIQSTLSTL